MLQLWSLTAAKPVGSGKACAKVQMLHVEVHGTSISCTSRPVSEGLRIQDAPGPTTGGSGRSRYHREHSAGRSSGKRGTSCRRSRGQVLKRAQAQDI